MRPRSVPVLLAPALALAMAACEPVPPAPAEPDPSRACGADGLQALVGQPASVLAAMTLPSSSRVLRPGMAMTMDYREDRLNIEIDRRARIVRVFCG